MVIKSQIILLFPGLVVSAWGPVLWGDPDWWEQVLVGMMGNVMGIFIVWVEMKL